MVLAAAVTVPACGEAARPDPAPGSESIRLREAATSWGVDFRHHHGGSGRRYMVETMPGGVVVFDFDGDGDEDLLFPDGGPLPGYEGEAPRTRLFRNEGGRRFVDVTSRSGIVTEGYGMGGAAGDVDGDGDLDLYLTAFGPNRLLRNEGDGTFSDVTVAAGVGEPRWSASAAFADPDRDGDLDLYVANYVDFTVAGHRPCLNLGQEVYCNPGNYNGEPDIYYRNLGDGRFEAATAAAGLETDRGRAGLGVVFGDLDGDGWPDLYVANDADTNYLFRNRGDGTFEETGLLSGTAYGDTGRPEAGMGVDLGDVDGDGLADLVVTNFELETNALYRNQGGLLFLDARYAANVAEPSLLDLAFGVAMADLDRDGDLDLAIANGHILDNAAELHESSRYAQEDRILENVGGRFRTVDGVAADGPKVGRGLATGDLDGDGDLEVVVANSNDRPFLYENVTSPAGWLLLDLRPPAADRFGVGVRVEVEAGGRSQFREVRAGSSYLSQSALALHFGLGEEGGAPRVTVRWVNGRAQRFEALPADRRVALYAQGAARGAAPATRR